MLQEGLFFWGDMSLFIVLSPCFYHKCLVFIISVDFKKSYRTYISYILCILLSYSIAVFSVSSTTSDLLCLCFKAKKNDTELHSKFCFINSKYS